MGFPEYVGVVKDFLIVIEDKAELNKHGKIDEAGLVSTEQADIKKNAINGAIFYGKHLVKNTSYKKVFALGISGDEKRHRISPYFIDDTEFYRELPELESLISFNANNIEIWMIKKGVWTEIGEFIYARTYVTLLGLTFYVDMFNKVNYYDILSRYFDAGYYGRLFERGITEFNPFQSKVKYADGTIRAWQFY